MKLIYRTSLADPVRTLPSYVKGVGLTNGEIDGNFKEIQMEMETKATTTFVEEVINNNDPIPMAIALG